jgi:hypothetical protein
VLSVHGFLQLSVGNGVENPRLAICLGAYLESLNIVSGTFSGAASIASFIARISPTWFEVYQFHSSSSAMKHQAVWSEARVGL